MTEWRRRAQATAGAGSGGAGYELRLKSDRKLPKISEVFAGLAGWFSSLPASSR